MPRKTPEKYSQSYWTIVEVVISQGEFIVEAEDKKEALSIRASFYGYVRSLNECNYRTMPPESATRYKQMAGAANKVMVKLDGTRVLFQDKAKHGHAVTINKALEKAGLSELIPEESKS